VEWGGWFGRLKRLVPTKQPGYSLTHDVCRSGFCYRLLRPRTVKREFRKLLATAGIRSIRLYDLRHTAATLGIAAGVSVKVISDQLGHASIAFTLERYSHVLPSIQDEAAAKVERLLIG
jgi:integrase